MMDLERVRETIFYLVDCWCSEDPVYRVAPSWIKGQISFAFLIGAITRSEKIELNCRILEAKEDEYDG